MLRCSYQTWHQGETLHTRAWAHTGARVGRTQSLRAERLCLCLRTMSAIYVVQGSQLPIFPVMTLSFPLLRLC